MRTLPYVLSRWLARLNTFTLGHNWVATVGREDGTSVMTIMSLPVVRSQNGPAKLHKNNGNIRDKRYKQSSSNRFTVHAAGSTMTSAKIEDDRSKLLDTLTKVRNSRTCNIPSSSWHTSFCRLKALATCPQRHYRFLSGKMELLEPGRGPILGDCYSLLLR